MNKKYKLIKQYPGSPQLGTIAEKFFNSALYFLGQGRKTLAEFWEEIIELPAGTKVIDTWEETKGYTYQKMENGKWFMGSIDNYSIDEKSIGEGKRFQILKDYEILSFKNESFGTIWIKDANGRFYPPKGKLFFIINNFSGTPESWFLQFPDKWEIYSVKRLSDDVIFTIDDDIMEQNEHSKIKHFEILDGFLLIRINHQITKGSSTISISSNFEKYIPKKPLFTTEDGVDIYEGDTFWRVNKDLSKPYDSLPINSQYAYKAFFDNGTKHFSTKEKAQEYIDSLKPKVLFTTMDGKEIFEGDPFYVYDKEHYKCVNAKGGEFKDEKWGNYRWANKDIVLNLIFKNKPCLSLNDVASIYITASREKVENSNDQGSKIHALVRKKLNK